MRSLTTIEKGVCEAVLVVTGCAALGILAVRLVPAPNPDLMSDVASLGTGLLVAYVIEAVWLTRRMRGVVDYEKRLGVFAGLAMTGLMGIVVALLIAAHRAAGHTNLLDEAGTSWTVVSLGILGGLVVTQPLLVHEWSFDEEEGESSG